MKAITLSALFAGNKIARAAAFAAVAGMCWMPASGGMDDVVLKCETNIAPCSYRVGEKMEFVFSLLALDAAEPIDGLKLKWKRQGDDGLPLPPYAVYNIGNNSPENLLEFVSILQEELIRAGVLPSDYDFEAHKQLVPMQPGDVPTTYADATALERDFGFTPKITLRQGLREFAKWYKQFYG